MVKKLINQPKAFVDEVMEGILFAYGDRLRFLNGDKRIILSNEETSAGKVGLVTAGGSGHLPLFLGYVGSGMLDGCTVGNVFASPSAQKMANMICACDKGNGVLCMLGNYGGDRMNFEMACETAELEGVRTRTVIARDDVASSPKSLAERRRGVAGMIYAFKIAGAAADQMMSLDEVAEVAQKALDNTRSMGVALSPCIVPEAGVTSFQIKEDEIEIGMGIHGEPGIEVRKMMTADEVACTILNKILEDMPVNIGDEVSVMVNGLGSTPLEELILVYRRLYMILESKGISICMPHIGEFATSMEMAGLSVSVIKLDAQLKKLLRAPANTPFYTSVNK